MRENHSPLAEEKCMPQILKVPGHPLANTPTIALGYRFA
jgi:hypothetical protein